MKYLVLILTVLLQFKSFAQTSRLPNAIIEYKHAEYTIKDVNNVHLKYKFKIQILNAKGQKYGNAYINTDNESKLKSFKATITDVLGNKVYSASKSDLVEFHVQEYYTLYSDNKVKYKELNYYQYPYTVEYEYEVDYKVFLGIFFSVIEDYGLPTGKALLTVKTAKGIDYLYKTNQFEGKEDRSVMDDMNVCTWKSETVQAMYEESFAPSFWISAPSIYITPQKINYNGYSGSMDSWKNFGKWSWTLLENRNELPEETRKLILKLTETEPDTLKKIRILYKHLQQSTRYIGVQDGIRGVQPFPAAYVDQNKYGDCKGLSNYMNAMLSVIGVNGIYTEIGHGKNQIIRYEDFPSFYQTNHIIVVVPLKKDTVWLECTSKEYPFGYIGKGNSDRKALAITSSGGKLINTPVYTLENNISNINASMQIQENGSMACNARYTNSGVMLDELIRIRSLDKKEQEQYLLDKFPSRELTVKKYSIKETSDVYPSMTFDVEMEEMEFASKTGDMISFTPNYLRRFKNPFNSNEERVNDIQSDYSFQEHDTVTITLPEGYMVEHLPEPKTLDTEFGKFKTEFIQKGNQVVYIRHSIRLKGRFSKDKYVALVDFFKQIQVADQQKIYLKRR
ncbi:MAG: DUF3857 domain-containing protein [Sporocytophaga sp.]|uniref:DUF3857 domain-containing protein n=1 Tax=Sporocytophaga sp. TaxID=2231183 RepID=UPI001AFD533A|nr:DUF3857 domain-containing protein [Sporocytophaga sp.]MBO9703359.1 DUF3857 domain-containing protein [Sporocytophaga sp.]